jgi:hypothetical protein
MRLVRSSRRVKKGKEKGEGEGGRRREKGTGTDLEKASRITDMARFGGNRKNLENSGNKMRVNLVSSIAFP